MNAVLNHAGGDGVAGQAGGVVNIEFIHQALTVFLDRLNANAEFSRDLFVGGTFSDVLKGSGLTRRQASLGCPYRCSAFVRFSLCVTDAS